MQDEVKLYFVKEKKAITSFLSYRIDSDFLMPVDAFEFELSAPRESLSLTFDQLFEMTLPLRDVEIYVNGNLQMLGSIDIQTIGDNGSTIKIQGRDYLANLVEAVTEPTTRVLAGMTIEAAILKILTPFGISEVVANNAEWRTIQMGVPFDEFAIPDKPFDKGSRTIRETKTIAVVENGQLTDKTSTTTKVENDTTVADNKPQPNEKVWSCMEKMVARKAYTIQPAKSRGKITFCKPDYDQPSSYSLTRHLDGKGNNIIGGTVRRDYSTVPTYTFAYGKFGQAVEKLTDGKHAASTFSGTFSDIGRNPEVLRIVKGRTIDTRFKPDTVHEENDGLLYRPLFIHDSDSKTLDEFEHTVNRSVAEDLKNTLQVEYTVKGHSDKNGLVWTVDTLVDVDDELGKVNEQLYICGRTFAGSGSGTTTTLKLWRPQSFVI